MGNKMNTTDDNLFTAEAMTASASEKKGMTVQEIVFTAICAAAGLLASSVMPLVANVPIYGIIQVVVSIQTSLFLALALYKVRKRGAVLLFALCYAIIQLFMPTVEREIDFACASAELKQYVIEKLRLEELLERHPFSLSEGQKRKIAVAAIACSAPQLLFLDEPTVGQDNESLAALIEVLLHLNQTYHTALVCVSHDKRCIEALNDRVFHL